MCVALTRACNKSSKSSLTEAASDWSVTKRAVKLQSSVRHEAKIGMTPIIHSILCTCCVP